MTTWHDVSTAHGGEALRVRIRSDQRRVGEPAWRELPFKMILVGDRWHYARTMVPVYPWHVPHEWSADDFTEDERTLFEIRAQAAYGSPIMPSGRSILRSADLVA